MLTLFASTLLEFKILSEDAASKTKAKVSKTNLMKVFSFETKHDWLNINIVLTIFLN